MAIISTPNASQALAHALKSGPIERPSTLCAARCVWHLSRSAGCRGPLHQAGVLPVLIRLVRGMGLTYINSPPCSAQLELFSS